MPKGTQLVLGNGSGNAASPEDKESQIKAVDVLCSGAARELREHLSEVVSIFLPTFYYKQFFLNAVVLKHSNMEGCLQINSCTEAGHVTQTPKLLWLEGARGAGGSLPPSP